MRKKLGRRFNAVLAGNQVTFGNSMVAGAAIFKKATTANNPANAAVNPADNDNDAAGTNNTHTS